MSSITEALGRFLLFSCTILAIWAFSAAAVISCSGASAVDLRRQQQLGSKSGLVEDIGGGTDEDDIQSARFEQDIDLVAGGRMDHFRRQAEFAPQVNDHLLGLLDGVDRRDHAGYPDSRTFPGYDRPAERLQQQQHPNQESEIYQTVPISD